MSNPDSLPALPVSSHQVFRKSTFFSRNHDAQLPTPAQVRARCKAAGGKPGWARPLPARFPSLGLLVKFGPDVSAIEGQCLSLLQRESGLRVPKVYGWTTEDGLVYIYMELIPGVTLEERWAWLSASDKESITHELHAMMNKLRSVQPDSADSADAYVDASESDPSRIYSFFTTILLRAHSHPLPPFTTSSLSRSPCRLGLTTRGEGFSRTTPPFGSHTATSTLGTSSCPRLCGGAERGCGGHGKSGLRPGGH